MTNLEHTGVLGMKWGRRKGGISTSNIPANIVPKKTKVDERAREAQFRNEYENRNKMSTRAMQNRVKRLQTEQQFHELVNKPAVARAKAEAEATKKRKERNKKLLKVGLNIYGNIPLDMYGDKGKRLKKQLGPSQALAKSASSMFQSDTSESLQHSIKEISESTLFHAGVDHKYIKKYVDSTGRMKYVYNDGDTKVDFKLSAGDTDFRNKTAGNKAATDEFDNSSVRELVSAVTKAKSKRGLLTRHEGSKWGDEGDKSRSTVTQRGSLSKTWNGTLKSISKLLKNMMFK